MTVLRTDFPDLTLFRRGKVRDVYDLGSSLLIVATDRISAFDVIMANPVPEKGAILTQLSTFWFDKTRHIVANHVISTNPDEYPEETTAYREVLQRRSMLVRKTKPIEMECVVRGYLAGSAWKEYQENGSICGTSVSPGLRLSSRLPEPMFTPATKEFSGHDINISIDEAIVRYGEPTVRTCMDASIALYTFAAEYALRRGIILADTKFEFGVDTSGQIILIDEALTPDSSRYWLAETYQEGQVQVNFDKQVLRDYLESTQWNKQEPGPTLPDELIDQIIGKYREALTRLLADA